MKIATPVQAAHVVATDEDEKFVRVIEQYDEYLADQQHAIELLKQGFLKLTMAKMNLPTHALGELSYKDDFEAALYVTEEHDGTLTIVKDGDRVTNSNSPPDSPVESSSNVLKHRKDPEAKTKVHEANDDYSRPVSTRANQEDATIMWFSSLPPTNLRVAQKNFRSGSLKMAGETTTPTPSGAADSATTGTRLTAQLSCRYFRPGGIVRGFVQLLAEHTTADASTEIASVVAQIHAHVSVDSNLLSVPLNLSSPRSSPPPTDSAGGLERADVAKFSGEAGSCLYLSAPCVLLSDLNVAPSPSESKEDTRRRCRRDFAIALPENPCPTFRGASARVFYVLSITANPLTSNPVAVHLPFDVYASDYSFAPESIANSQDPAKRRGSRKERSVSLVVAPVGVRKGSEIPFELRPSLMHGRVETEQLQRAQTSLFTIGKDDAHLVKLLLAKQFYHPGDVLLGVFDFSRASIPCVEISATLCQEEVLASMALQPSKAVQSKVLGTFHEYTASALQTNVRFSIPHDALPTIKTDLVCFQWCIRFEFSANVTAADASTAAGSSTTQIFRWQVPIEVRPSTSREPSSFTNVPHKLFSGSSRTAMLA